MTEQPYLGSALLTPHGEGPYKSGSKHCLPHHTLASRPRLERMPSSGTQIIMKKKKTRVRPITLAAWNVRTMQDREGTACPQRRTLQVDYKHFRTSFSVKTRMFDSENLLLFLTSTSLWVLYEMGWFTGAMRSDEMPHPSRPGS